MYNYMLMAVMLCFSVISTGFTQETTPEENVLFPNAKSRSFLKQWYMSGPIPIEDIVAEMEQKEHFDANEDSENPGVYQAQGQVFLGWAKYKQAFLYDILSIETNPSIQPKIGVPTLIQNKTYEWVLQQTNNRSFNFNNTFGQLSNVIVYAYAEIPVEIDKTMYMAVGSDDAMSMWVNGENVYTYLDDRQMNIEDDNFPVNLKKGVNQILVKIMNVHGEWGFSVRIYDTNDLPVKIQVNDMVSRFVDTSNNNASVIWIPVILGLLTLFAIIATFLVIAKLYGGGDKLHH